MRVQKCEYTPLLRHWPVAIGRYGVGTGSIPAFQRGVGRLQTPTESVSTLGQSRHCFQISIGFLRVCTSICVLRMVFCSIFKKTLLPAQSGSRSPLVGRSEPQVQKDASADLPRECTWAITRSDDVVPRELANFCLPDR